MVRTKGHQSRNIPYHTCVLCGHKMQETYMTSTSSGWICKSMKNCLHRIEVTRRYNERYGLTQ